MPLSDLPSSVSRRISRLESAATLFGCLFYVAILLGITCVAATLEDFFTDDSYKTWSENLHKSPYIIAESPIENLVESRTALAHNGSYRIYYSWDIPLEFIEAQIDACQKLQIDRVILRRSVLPNGILGQFWIDLPALQDGLTHAKQSDAKTVNWYTIVDVNSDQGHNLLYRAAQEVMIYLDCGHIVAITVIVIAEILCLAVICLLVFFAMCCCLWCINVLYAPYRTTFIEYVDDAESGPTVVYEFGFIGEIHRPGFGSAPTQK